MHPKRSSGSLKKVRVRVPWPSDKVFRILSIDGGGMRGIFPVGLLGELEERFLNGRPIGRHFDLIAGTSTGGIIAVGLGAGISASRLLELYVDRGCEIFPPSKQRVISRALRCLHYSYDTEALSSILAEMFGSKKFGESVTRLCIPSFEGQYGEPYIFKTPHHPDFVQDGSQLMSTVATCTSVAPTFFKPLKEHGYIFLDGGVWANNPIMVGLVDVLSCFEIERDQIRILSLGCGDSNFQVSNTQIRLGGILSWLDIIYAAMKLQSHNALGQAGLLIGADKILRISPPNEVAQIALDDCTRAAREIPCTVDPIVDEFGERIYTEFLSDDVRSYTPLTL